MARNKSRTLKQNNYVKSGIVIFALLMGICLTLYVATRPVSTQSHATSPLSLCGNVGTPPPIQHVIVVMMENRSYNAVVGSTNAPFQTSLTSSCGVGTAMFSATHTSAANYLAISAGVYPSTSPPGCGSVKGCSDTSNNIYNQLTSAGLTWRGYMESMLSACNPKSTDGVYKIGHNPIIFYSNIPSALCQTNDVGVNNLTAQTGAFWNDLQNQTLPSFSLISPNEGDDGEGSGTAAQNEQVADTWLQNFISTVQQSNSYQAGNTLILITYDEGTGADTTVGEDCTNQNLDMPVTNGVSAHQDSCHVPFFVVYPYTKAGISDGTFFDHYSITKTIEDIFGLPYLAHASDTQTTSLLNHFGLTLGTATPTINATPPTTSPTVAITQPTNGTTVSGTLSLSGTVNDSVGISQVEVSVDNGTPQTANGTTNWTSSIDTTNLSKGSHTITVSATDTSGNTGSSSVMISVNNSVTTACPAIPAGMTELSGNISLETNQNGWTGVYNSNSNPTRIAINSGSYDGSWALEVSPKVGTSGVAGVNNANPIWVPGSSGISTNVGHPYTGSAYVQASTPGEQISLLVRETTPSGTGINYHNTTVTLNDTAWHQISSLYTAQNSGDVIRYSLYSSNFTNSNQYFLADCLSLQTH